MQRINCTVLLSGKKTDSVYLEGVTPAELVILREIHKGKNPPIENPEPMPNGKGQERTSHDAERHRLEKKYSKPLVDRLFPSHLKRSLPVTFHEVGESFDFSVGSQVAASEQREPVAVGEE